MGGKERKKAIPDPTRISPSKSTNKEANLNLGKGDVQIQLPSDFALEAFKPINLSGGCVQVLCAYRERIDDLDFSLEDSSPCSSYQEIPPTHDGGEATEKYKQRTAKVNIGKRSEKFPNNIPTPKAKSTVMSLIDRPSQNGKEGIKEDTKKLEKTQRNSMERELDTGSPEKTETLGQKSDIEIDPRKVETIHESKTTKEDTKKLEETQRTSMERGLDTGSPEKTETLGQKSDIEIDPRKVETIHESKTTELNVEKNNEVLGVVCIPKGNVIIDDYLGNFEFREQKGKDGDIQGNVLKDKRKDSLNIESTDGRVEDSNVILPVSNPDGNNNNNNDSQIGLSKQTEQISASRTTVKKNDDSLISSVQVSDDKKPQKQIHPTSVSASIRNNSFEPVGLKGRVGSDSSRTSLHSASNLIRHTSTPNHQRRYSLPESPFLSRKFLSESHAVLGNSISTFGPGLPPSPFFQGSASQSSQTSSYQNATASLNQDSLFNRSPYQGVMSSVNSSGEQSLSYQTPPSKSFLQPPIDESHNFSNQGMTGPPQSNNFMFPDKERVNQNEKSSNFTPLKLSTKSLKFRNEDSYFSSTVDDSYQKQNNKFLITPSNRSEDGIDTIKGHFDRDMETSSAYSSSILDLIADDCPSIQREEETKHRLFIPSDVPTKRK